MFSLASYFSSTGYSQVINTETQVENPSSPQTCRKPYQAYCETEVSSRTSTPDSLIPRPLNTTKTRTRQQAINSSASASKSRSTNKSTSNDGTRWPDLQASQSSHFPPAAHDEWRCENAHVPASMQYKREKRVYENRTASLRVTVSMNQYPSVPRSSHPTVPVAAPISMQMPVAGYARVCQRAEQRRVSEVVRRKDQWGLALREEGEGERESGGDSRGGAVETDVETGVNKSRPLPALPTEEEEEEYTEIEIGIGAQESSIDVSAKQACTQGATRRDSHGAKLMASACPFPPSPSSLSPSASSSPQHRAAHPSHTLPSPSPSRPKEPTPDAAHRRTLPKDAQLPFPFGQRPPACLDHNHAHLLPLVPTAAATTIRTPYLDRPLPPLPVCAETTSLRAGPRQPPWGSLDRLGRQRQTRRDWRAREQAWVYRARRAGVGTGGGGWGCAGDAVGVGAGAGAGVGAAAAVDGVEAVAMKAEVEGFRAQIVRVYPDMLFDGNAGKGGRACCCAVM